MASGSTLFVDHQIGTALIDGVRNASREVIIVSPYIKLWTNLERDLRKAKGKGVRLSLFYRTEDAEKAGRYGSRINVDELKTIFDELVPVDTLHAKIYVFDDDIVLSSMNLYEYSQQSSREIAIRIADAGQRREIREYIDTELRPQSTRSAALADSNVMQAATQIMGELGKLLGVGAVNSPPPVVAPKSTKSPVAPRQSTATTRTRSAASGGHCIRCQGDIRLNPDKPLCPACYKVWALYSDPTYKERYCHSCGKEGTTSVAKPECLSCFKKAATQSGGRY